MNAAWVEAVQMSRLGDAKGALKKLREAEANDPTPGAAWEIGMYRLRVLLQMGRAADALDLVDEVCLLYTSDASDDGYRGGVGGGGVR